MVGVVPSAFGQPLHTGSTLVDGPATPERSRTSAGHDPVIQVLDDAPEEAPVEPKLRWYGWQVLLTDALALTSASVSPSIAVQASYNSQDTSTRYASYPSAQAESAIAVAGRLRAGAAVV